MEKLVNTLGELLSGNSELFSVEKLLEEMAELQIELLKKYTKYKPNQFSLENVAHEIADVYIRLHALVEMWDIGDKVNDAIEKKLEKLKGYAENGKYVEF